MWRLIKHQRKVANRIDHCPLPVREEEAVEPPDDVRTVSGTTGCLQAK